MKALSIRQPWAWPIGKRPGGRDMLLAAWAGRFQVLVIAIETRVKLERRAAQEKSDEATPPAATPAPKKPGKKRLKDLDQAELEAAATGEVGDLAMEGEA